MRKESIRKLYDSAKRYRDKFEGMDYAFVYRDSNGDFAYKEVTFKPSSFKHLTGVETSMSPVAFYNACLNNRLPANITERKMDIAEVKLSVLPSLLNTVSHRYIGEFITSGIVIQTDTLIGNLIGCLGIDITKGGRFYYPKTVIRDSIETRAHEPSKIIAIMSKRIDKKPYSIANYISRSVTLERIEELLNGKPAECDG